MTAVAKVLGGSATKPAAVAAVVAIAATGGVVVLESDVFKPGDPEPFRLGGVRTPGGRPVKAGDPVPPET